MKLLFKERFFSWFDSYDIYNEHGETMYTVEGKLAFGHCLHIMNACGQHIGTVQEKVLALFPKFSLYEGDRNIGEIQKLFTVFKPRFTMECMGWTVEGDFMEWDYRIMDSSGRIVASIEKSLWKWTDTYILDIARQEDALYVLMVVLAIDAAKCSQND